MTLFNISHVHSIYLEEAYLANCLSYFLASFMAQKIKLSTSLIDKGEKNIPIFPIEKKILTLNFEVQSLNCNLSSELSRHKADMAAILFPDC